MKWTNKKPTEDGYYWLKMPKEATTGSEQKPRVVKVETDTSDGETLWKMEGPYYDEFDAFEVGDMSENFLWSNAKLMLPAY